MLSSVRVDPVSPDPAAIARAASLLRDGAVVAFPTETVYGLGACASNAEAVRAIFRAKGRPPTHPLIVHVTDVEMAMRVAAASFPESARRLCAAFWPGPLTVIVPRAERLAPEVSGGGATVGIRAPQHPVARALIEALGDGIAAPSANRYQGVSATRAEHVASAFSEHEIAMILDGGPCHEGIESTVVDCTSKVPTLLRLGAISADALAALVGDLRIRGDVVVAETDLHASPGLAEAHYRPRARVTLASAANLRPWVASAKGCIGVIAHSTSVGSTSVGSTSVVLVRLPSEARGYARGLYAAMHELDAAGVEEIFVEEVPGGDAWAAVADRLHRASVRA